MRLSITPLSRGPGVSALRCRSAILGLKSCGSPPTTTGRLSRVRLSATSWRPLPASARLDAEAGKRLACAVSKMLGHASFVTTLTVYAYCITEGDGGKTRRCLGRPLARQLSSQCASLVSRWLVVIFVVAGIIRLSSLNDHIMFGRVSEAGFRSFQAS